MFHAAYGTPERGVSKTDPKQQGLKLAGTMVSMADGTVSKTDPKQQGLKHRSIRIGDLATKLSQRLIQNNKD